MKRQRDERPEPQYVCLVVGWIDGVAVGVGLARGPSFTSAAAVGYPPPRNSTAITFVAREMVTLSSPSPARPALGLAYAWSGFVVMWMFWVCFVVFLASPRQWYGVWPLPMIDQGKMPGSPLVAALADLGLVALFGLQHSLMARPWFKACIAAYLPSAFERCTYVHTANMVLLALIMLWQPIPVDLWNAKSGIARAVLWALFAIGWVILFLSAWSFGMRDLLGVRQMEAFARGEIQPRHRLRTGWLYRWLRHPMYVGVLLGVWATPRMTIGHAILALGLTGYVLIAVRYEERDLRQRFGRTYVQWRDATR
jgi:protein-S-isoprenylcysteine O-methyltransferase Ste14